MNKSVREELNKCFVIFFQGKLKIKDVLFEAFA